MMTLECGPSRQPLAAALVVQSFFDTVACRLESTRRGSLYPLLLDRLHDGRISSRDAPAALQELSAIQGGLDRLPPSQILSSFALPQGAISAGQVFAALIARLRTALEASAHSGQPLYLIDAPRRRMEFYFGWCAFLGGMAWCLFVYALFPKWYLVSAVVPDAQDGIPIWRAGYVPIALSLVYIVSSRSAALRYWFLRRQWAVLSLAVLGAVAFAVLSSVKFH